ncbi:MAG: trehalose-6-phosphate synthase [Acidobacteriota bacterium]|nr:trehalose-6-phosphate synthase [Acidobacteriota bacterium]
MRFSFRLMLSLFIAITLVSLVFAVYQVQAENRNRRNELERRAQILAESLQETVEPLLLKGAQEDLQRIVERFGNRERLAGVAIYDDQRRPVLMTASLTPRSSDVAPVVDKAMSQGRGAGTFFNSDLFHMHVYAVPLRRGSQTVGALAVFHDASYIEAQDTEIWRNTFFHMLVQMLVVGAITLLIVRWSMVRPIARMTQWLNDMRAGKPSPEMPAEDVFTPLTREITHLATSLRMARASAEEEARLREASDSLWTAERLRVYLEGALRDSRLFVVSNREPYEHVYRGSNIETRVPASGLVTAMEPILRACDGMWVAQGAGDADRATVDEHDRLRVPPEQPQYTLRRVWLTREEEEGYYYGFANEGLWPLCHIAHTRPIFRVEDWEHYKAANQKFADAVLEEMATTERPIVLAQDYHFALLPRLIKEKRPDARVAIFWHIPWPNPEAFAICPWRRELLEGLLGADLIGFHTQLHCNNFLQTVDRTVESRIEWERPAIIRGRHSTSVRPFPISVEFNDAPAKPVAGDSVFLERVALLKKLGVEADILGMGVDRLDYTKGIPERFRGIERFLEKHPSYCGRFTFVQIGAPTRTHIKRYKDLITEVEAEAERINWRFHTSKWKPIVFLQRHHSHEEIDVYYRVADFCMVTSLHDGMNLVAKEFVASRDDEGGALILSGFTGASQELLDALIINPYDTEQMAEAIRFALEMDPRERRQRMHNMRHVVKGNNIYRWAANLTGAVSEIRIESFEKVKPVVLAERVAVGK